MAVPLADNTTKKKRPKRKKKNQESAMEDERVVELEEEECKVEHSQEEEEEEECTVEHSQEDECRVEECRVDKVTDWVDITELCEEALADMAIGEMLEAEGFNLYHAMSAIEMMDPKMDSGYEAPLTLEEAKASLATDLNDREQANIMDEFLCQYISWLDGHSLATTIFSCIYLHCWDILDQIPPLRTFCALLLKMVRIARETIVEANFYDEEDSPHHFNLCLSPPEGPVAFGGAHTARRIEFISVYLTTLEGEKDGFPELLSLLTEIEADNGGLSNDCFTVKITRSLMVPGPPRDVPLVTREEGVAKWRNHIRCGQFVGTQYAEIRENFTLAAALGPQDAFFSLDPDILSRSQAYLTLTQSDNTQSGNTDHIEKAVKTCLVEDWLLPESIEQYVDNFGEFVTNAAKFFVDWLKVRHCSQARQHRRAIHLLCELNSLQNEAGMLDERLIEIYGENLVNNRALSGFIINQALQVLVGHLEIGFQLDIYDDIELSMIYWFMDYLYGLLVFTHNEVLCLKEEPKKNRRRTKQAFREPKNASALVLQYRIRKELCRGLFRLHVALTGQNAIKATENMKETMPMRYSLRFRNFDYFQLPHTLTYAEFLKSCTISEDINVADTLRLLDAASSSFRDVKVLVEEAKDKGLDMSAPKRVCVANTLVISQIAKRVTSGHKIRAAFSNNYHPVFISTKLVD